MCIMTQLTVTIINGLLFDLTHLSSVVMYDESGSAYLEVLVCSNSSLQFLGHTINITIITDQLPQ